MLAAEMERRSGPWRVRRRKWWSAAARRGAPRGPAPAPLPSRTEDSPTHTAAPPPTTADRPRARPHATSEFIAVLRPIAKSMSKKILQVAVGNIRRSSALPYNILLRWSSALPYNILRINKIVALHSDGPGPFTHAACQAIFEAGARRLQGPGPRARAAASICSSLASHEGSARRACELSDTRRLIPARALIKRPVQQHPQPVPSVASHLRIGRGSGSGRPATLRV